MEWTTVLWVYVAGVALFFLLIDEPVASRLAIAAIWPIPILILALVIVILLLSACLFWWPLAFILAGIVAFIVWMI